MPETIEEIEVKVEIKVLESEERQTIVHCKCNGPGSEAYRIWPSTFLIEHGNKRKVKLITAYNISFAPLWTLNDGRGFTLIFEGLSKSCKAFDLIEMIPEEGGFEVLDIKRNKTDVYRVNL